MGSRGIPGKHGGFETFAEQLSLYLTEHGWDVEVFCQLEGQGRTYTDNWRGIRRINIYSSLKGALGTVLFDWRSVLKARKKNRLVLLLGYNTAIFSLFLRLKKIKVIINMDGIEWKRDKWRVWERAWLFINEFAGIIFSSHLVADHPQIKKRLKSLTSAGRITYIPYSAPAVIAPDRRVLNRMRLIAHSYSLLIARPEPENSILEIISAYSRKKRPFPLVVLGEYDRDNDYHKSVLDAAGEDIRFVGAIYDKSIVQALRIYARFYIHGHTVGGTNPSLVESLAAGSAVLAAENRFNRLVAAWGGVYFQDETSCAEKLDLLLTDDDLIAVLKNESRKQFANHYRPEKVYHEYEDLLSRFTTSLNRR